MCLAAVAYLDRVCISAAAGAMRSDLGLTAEQMGYVFSAFTLAYALFEVPSGWLADRFGPRLMLARVVIWWSLMTALTGWVWGFMSLLLVRFLFGMGEAGTYPGISRAFSRWLPLDALGGAFGITVAAGVFGGALTQRLTVTCLEHLSWRCTFMLYSMAGLAWAAAWVIWFRDDPHVHKGVNQEELRLIGSHPPKPHPPVPWRAMLRNRGVAAICLMYLGTIYGWYLYLTWLPTYLNEARGFNMRAVGWLSAMPLFCIGLSVLGGGWLSDRLCRRFGLRWGRRLPGLIGLPLAIVALVAAVFTSHPLASALLFGLSAGLSALGVAAGWAVCLEIGGDHAGVVTGAMNMFGNMGGALSPVVLGCCLQRWHSWNHGLLTVAFFYAMAAVCWLWIDPLHPLEKRLKQAEAPQRDQENGG